MPRPIPVYVEEADDATREVTSTPLKARVYAANTFPRGYSKGEPVSTSASSEDSGYGSIAAEEVKSALKSFETLQIQPRNTDARDSQERPRYRNSSSQPKDPHVESTRRVLKPQYPPVGPPVTVQAGLPSNPYSMPYAPYGFTPSAVPPQRQRPLIYPLPPHADPWIQHNMLAHPLQPSRRPLPRPPSRPHPWIQHIPPAGPTEFYDIPPSPPSEQYKRQQMRHTDVGAHYADLPVPRNHHVSQMMAQSPLPNPGRPSDHLVIANPSSRRQKTERRSTAGKDDALQRSPENPAMRNRRGSVDASPQVEIISSSASDESVSTDTSLLGLSEYSDDEPSLDDNHPFLRVKHLALKIVLDAFQHWKKVGPEGMGAQHDTQSSHKENDPGSSREPGQSLGSKGKGKRARSSQNSYRGREEREDDSVTSQGVSTKRQRTRATNNKLHFACPYAKKDPSGHRDCFRFTLTRIRDVKQHLVRKHRLPFYCPRCRAEFPDEASRDEHSRLTTTCDLRDLPPPEGVTEAQRRQLSKKPPPNLTEEQQWFAVFDILFPGHEPRPSSPYVDNELLLGVTLYQDFVTSEGPQILSDFLTMRGAVTWNLPNEERDLAAFQRLVLVDGLRIVFQQWASQNGIPLAESSIQSGSDGSGETEHTPPSSTDSTTNFEGVRQESLRAASGILSTGIRNEHQGSDQEDADLVQLGAGLDALEPIDLEELQPLEPMEMSSQEHEEFIRAILTDQSGGQDPWSGWMPGS